MYLRSSFANMLLRNFLFVIVLSIGSNSRSQTITSVSGVLNSNIPLEKKLLKTDSILQLLSYHKEFITLDSEYNSYIRWLYWNKNYAKNINVIENGLKPHQIESSKDLKWHYLGRTYYALKKYDKSIAAYEHIITKNNDNDISGRSYSELGRCYQQKGNYYKAIDNFLLAESILKKVNSPHVLLANYINITTPYLQLESITSYKRALDYYLKADSLANRIKASDYYRYHIKTGIGDYYNRSETLDIPKSSTYYQQALAIAEKNKDSSLISNTYNKMGNLYNTTDPNMGISYQKKSLKYTPKNDSILLASIYWNMASCYRAQYHFDQSIVTSHNAMNLLDANKIFDKSHNKGYLLRVVSELGNTYLKEYNSTSNKKSLSKAIQTFRLADRLIDLIRIEIREFQSKLFWRKQSSELYGKAIQACYMAGDAEQAFFFMEKNKALLLTEDLKRQQLQQAQLLPDSIINDEIRIKKELYSLQHSTIKNKDSVIAAILSTERALQKLQDRIAQHYISYKSLQTQSPILSLAEVQNSLLQDTAVLMYNIGEYNDYGKITPENSYTPVIPNCVYGVKTLHPAYGLLITNQKVKFFKLKNVEHLQQKAQNLIELMKKPFAKPSDQHTYATVAFGIYEKLLPSDELRTLIKGKKLRIVPDNYLHFLPFEALKTTSGSDSNYWLQDNEMSYAYSNSFLKNIQKHDLKKQLSFVGFAPVTFLDSTLVPLYNSPEELTDSSSYFESLNYLEEKATKEQFLEVFSEKDIIHLATHADAQDSIAPWIAFRDKKLVQDELSLTTNRAQLVVLSGCNTLLGTQEMGEGVMSLARGFFHSGAQSVVSSLWNADDQSTATIMKTFYKNLDNGQSKSTALHNAKLTYLQKHELSEASPYYWASFVLLGNESPLISSPRPNWYWLLLLFPLIGYLFYKRLSRKY